MTLLELLLTRLDKEVVLFDKNERIIAYGKSNELIKVLGSYLLELKVVRTDIEWIYLDVKLGGGE